MSFSSPFCFLASFFRSLDERSVSSMFQGQSDRSECQHRLLHHPFLLSRVLQLRMSVERCHIGVLYFAIPLEIEKRGEQCDDDDDDERIQPLLGAISLH